KQFLHLQAALESPYRVQSHRPELAAPMGFQSSAEWHVLKDAPRRLGHNLQPLAYRVPQGLTRYANRAPPNVHADAAIEYRQCLQSAQCPAAQRSPAHQCG